MSVPAGFRALPLPIVQLSLAAVLKCGQSFRWSIYPLLPGTETVIESSPTHEYRLCLRDRVVCLRQSPESLFYRSIFPQAPSSVAEEALQEAETLTWLRDYFQLDIDLMKLYEDWSNRDPVFRSLRSRFSGIRMLRQDPWENLVSFICSSNNNISRITKMVTSLCKHYSPPLLSSRPPLVSNGSAGALEVESYHPFPPPSVLATPGVGSVLRSLGFGYRAEFIQRTAEMLVQTHGAKVAHDAREESERWLTTLRNNDTSEAREELLKFMGVGRKVADCVLLMSLDKREVIPVDTHVHQIAIKHYGLRGSSGTKANMTPKLYDEVNTKLAKVWGDYAGWAHSVLFTADLKSFSSYGLPSPSPSAIITKTASPRKKTVKLPITPPLTPSPSPTKRKRVHRGTSQRIAVTAIRSAATALTKAEEVFEIDDFSSTSLADRVKKRRRVTMTVEKIT